ncbi:MAG TPA: hypothetical protein DCP08_03565 [Chloroflexi bacterium]|nr:hypothetical protein [Chloroflexota bacterium]
MDARPREAQVEGPLGDLGRLFAQRKHPFIQQTCGVHAVDDAKEVLLGVGVKWACSTDDVQEDYPGGDGFQKNIVSSRRHIHAGVVLSQSRKCSSRDRAISPSAATIRTA